MRKRTPPACFLAVSRLHSLALMDSIWSGCARGTLSLLTLASVDHGTWQRIKCEKKGCKMDRCISVSEVVCGTSLGICNLQPRAYIRAEVGHPPGSGSPTASLTWLLSFFYSSLAWNRADNLLHVCLSRQYHAASIIKCHESTTLSPREGPDELPDIFFFSSSHPQLSHSSLTLK